MTRESWLAVVQTAEGDEETELVVIERPTDGAPPVIELSDGTRITCTLPAAATQHERRAA